MKALGRAALRTAIALGALLAPWPGVGRTFAGVYSSVMNAFSGILAGGGRYQFSPEGPASSWNALLRLEDAGGALVVVSWDLRRAPFLPLAVFVALSFALPMRSRARRLQLVAVGVLLLQLPALLRLLLVLTAPPLTVLELPSWVQDGLFTACTALVFPPVMAFALPTLLFLALTWRLEPEALAALRPANTALIPPKPASPSYEPRAHQPQQQRAARGTARARAARQRSKSRRHAKS